MRGRGIYRTSATQARASRGLARALCQSLEQRTLLSTNTWSGANADWNTPADWSLGTVPNATDDVVINSGTVTVSTADLAETLTTAAGSKLQINAASLAINGSSSIGGTLSVGGGTLNNTDQTLTLGATASLNLASGGTIEGGTIAESGNAQLTATGGTLNGVILAANLTVNNGSTVDVTDGLTLNNANLTLASTGTSTYLYFQGTQSVGGTGQLIFGGSSSNNDIFVQGGNTQAMAATLTIGPSITVDGSEGGQIGGYYTYDSLVNQGTINANTSGQTITIGSSITWTNTGTLECSNGGTLGIAGTLNNTGQTLTLVGNSGPVTLNGGGTIQGGTVTTASGAQLIANNITLSGVALSTNLNVNNNASLYVTNGLALNSANITLASTGSETSIYFKGTQTLGGTGQIIFAGTSPDNQIVAQGGNSQATAATLTIGLNITIAGSEGGQIIGSYSYDSLVNQGTINANTSGQTITISAATSGTFTNSATIEATNGGILTINGTWTNTGTIAETNSTVNLGGFFTQASGGTFNCTGGSVNVTGTVSGTLAGVTLVITNGSALSDVTLDVNVILDSGFTLYVYNGLTLNNANITLSGNNATIFFEGTQALGGTGQIVFGGSNSTDYIYARGGNTQLSAATLTIGLNISMSGGNNAQIGGYYSYDSVINQGTINANVSGQTITVGASGAFTNSGTLEVSNGATLTTTGAWSGSGGTISENASTLNLGGSFAQSTMGTFSRTGGTVNITGTETSGLALNATTGSWNLLGGTINGGTITDTGGAELVLTTAGGALVGVTIPSGTVIDGTEAYNVSVGIYGGLTLNGTLNLGGGYQNGNYAIIYFYGSQTLSGSGTVVFGIGSNGGNLWAEGDNGNNPATLTIASGITIEGGTGNIRGYYSPRTSGPVTYTGDFIVNDGTIDADASGDTITVGSSGTVINNGTMEATSGAALNVGGLAGNINTFLVSGSGSNLTLNGTYVLNQNMSVPAGTALTLNGNWSNSAALTEAVGGTLTLGGTFTVAALGTFTNSGGTVNLTGTLNNASTTLALSPTTGSWNLLGGTINGGTITDTGGAELVLTTAGGALVGVTIPSGTVIDGTEAYNVSVGIYGGLTLNGTLNLGGGYQNGNYAIIYFYGSQTLSGSGTVVFGIGSNGGNLWAEGDNGNNPATLTIASGITIEGGTGNIRGYYSPRTSGPVTYTGDFIVNDGTIDADASGDTITVGSSGTVINNGTMEATSGAALNVGGLAGNINTFLVSGSGSNLTLNGTYVLNQNMSVPAGTALTLNGNWSNSAALTEAVGGTLTLGGTFTVAALGTFTNSGGTVNLTGTLNNASTTLALSPTTGSWNLLGGTINGGTITDTGGAELVLTTAGGALVGVTIPSGTVIDGTEAYNVSVGIYGGLTLNGTLNLGGGYQNGNYAIIYFYGSQTLSGSGTVVFGIGSNGGNLWAEGDNGNNPATLTIASGITIEGGTGNIRGYYSPRTSGPVTYTGDFIVNDGTIDADASGDTITVGSSGTVINNGTMEATSGAALNVGGLAGNINTFLVSGSGSNLTLNGTYVLNQNMSVPAGTALTLNGNWSNSAALTEAVGGTLTLGGTFTVAALGTFTNSGGTVNLTGTLNNASTTLALSPTTGSWNLLGGTINGGTITDTGGAELVLTTAGGALVGVTIPSGTVIDGTEAYNVSVGIYGGLTLNGTLNLGGGYQNGNYAIIYFYGSQTLSGSGTVVFGIGSNGGNLWAEGDNGNNPATLTIASGITIEGGTGNIRGYYSPRTSGPVTYTGDFIVNDGTIDADASGDTITVGSSGTVINNGTMEATNGGSLTLNNFTGVNGTSVLAGYGTGTLATAGNLVGDTTNAVNYNPLETTLLNGNGTVSSPQLLEAMSDDLGKTTAGYTNNFAYGALQIGSNDYVQLVDQSANTTSGVPEAVYAVSVTVPAGSTLNLNGLDLYAGSTNVQGTIVNGIINLSPLPPAVAAVSGNGQPIADNSSSASTSNGTNFGSLLENTTEAKQTYTITNNGIATLTLGGVTLPTGFALVTAPPASIPAHASATFVVGLPTTTVGTFGGNVSFGTNDSANNPYSFDIAGTVAAAAPVASISYDGQAIVDGARATGTANGTDFGSTSQGGAPVAHTFTISNFGNATLNLGTISLPSGFSLTGTPPAASVAAGDSTSFTIGLPTANFGTFSGVVSFSTNDAYNDPFNFEITGTITAAPAPITTVSFNGVAIADKSIGTSTSTGTDFGFSLQGGAPVVHTFTIYNIGNAILNLGTINLPTGFSLVGTPATSVGPGSSVSFTFGLDTSSVGTFTGNVTFSTNDSNNNPFTFAVTGAVGVTSSAYIAVTPPNLQVTTAGQSNSFTLGSFVETNATAPFAVTVNWGDGSANSVFSMAADGTIPAQDHTYASSGNPTVTISVVDSAAHSSNNATFSVDVVPAPATIVVTAPSNQIANPGQVNYIPLGSFSETGAVGPYNVTVNWGDGSALTTFSVNNAGTLPATPHTYANSGNNTVTLTVTDSVGHTSNSAAFNVNVATAIITLTAPSNQSATAGQSQAFALGSFTETNATGPYTVTVNWGDGSTESIFSVASPGVIPATAHSYNTVGSDTATITVLDSANHSSNSATFDVNVGQSDGAPAGLTVGAGGAYALTYTAGVQTLDIISGTITLGADLSNLYPNYDLKIENGANVVMLSNQHVGQLQLLGNSTLDITGSSLTIDYGGSTSDPLSTITSYIQSGFNSGAWNGPGIISSTAAADTSNTTGIGYYDSGSQITIARTWYGDANLDGVINTDDLSLIMLGQAQHGTRWQDGNFNYDTQVNADDWIELMYAVAYSQGQTLSSFAGDASVQSSNASLFTAQSKTTTPAFSTTPITSDPDLSDLIDSPEAVLN